MTPLTIYITVDTEFSVGDAFAAPGTGQPVGSGSVYCWVEGRSEGLGFMLDVLSQYGLHATFFVEALNTVWFGDEPMGSVARELVAAGHDVQLHMHPFWLYFQHPDWRERLSLIAPEDRTSGRTRDSLVQLLNMGLDAFDRWKVPRPVAFRSGGLDVDENVYHALRVCGFQTASNVGLAIYEPESPSLHLLGGAHLIHGVVELPILTYFAPGLRGHRTRKTLTITGSSWAEIRTLLWKARRAGYEQVVLLTHPFEYAKQPSRGGAFHVNKINQGRFRQLSEFIALHPEDFRTGVMRNVDPLGIRFGPVQPLNVSLLQAVGRMVTNRLNDSFIRL